jgi:hypothetical protein
MGAIRFDVGLSFNRVRSQLKPSRTNCRALRHLPVVIA